MIGYQAFQLNGTATPQNTRQIEDKSLDSQTWSERQRKSLSFVSGPADVCSSSSLNPPISPRFSLNSLRFMWRWGFLPPLPPQWPLALCVSQWNRAPQGSTSSPTNKQHTHPHVLLLWSLQVLLHTVKHTKSQDAHYASQERAWFFFSKEKDFDIVVLRW